LYSAPASQKHNASRTGRALWDSSDRPNTTPRPSPRTHREAVPAVTTPAATARRLGRAHRADASRPRFVDRFCGRGSVPFPAMAEPGRDPLHTVHRRAERR
jgi:hypothetical protein